MSGFKVALKQLARWLIRKELAERGGFEPPVGVLAPTTV